MSSRDLVAEERHVLAVLSSECFLRMEGLGNEVPFFIWAYPPQQELEVQEATGRILSSRWRVEGWPSCLSPPDRNPGSSP